MQPNTGTRARTHTHAHIHTHRTESVILVTMTRTHRRCIHTLRGRVGVGRGWRGDERGGRNVTAKCHSQC